MKKLVANIIAYVYSLYLNILNTVHVEAIKIAKDTYVSKTTLDLDELLKIRDGLEMIIERVSQNSIQVYRMSEFGYCVLGYNLQIETDILDLKWGTVVKQLFGVEFSYNAKEVETKTQDPLVRNLARLFCGGHNEKASVDSYRVTKKEWLKAARHVLNNVNKLADHKYFVENNLSG